MSCCGDRRRDVRPLRPALTAAPGPPLAPTALDYLGGADLALRGPMSGRIYKVGAARRQLLVEAADAPALLKTGLFIAG